MRLQIVGGPHDGAYLEVGNHCLFEGYVLVYAKQTYVISMKPHTRVWRLYFTHKLPGRSDNPRTEAPSS